MWKKRIQPAPNMRIYINRTIDGIVYVFAPSLSSLTAIDGYSGKKLGSIKDPGLLWNTNTICSGPVKYGNQVLMATELYWVAGESIRDGHLFSVTAPERKP